MSRRPVVASILALLLAAPSASPASLASLSGAARTTTGRPAAGVDLDLVNLDTGQVTGVRTDGAGAFRAQLTPGSYAVSTRRGYSVVRGPRVVRLVAGEAASAELAVASLAAASANEDEDDDDGVAGWLGPAVVVAGATTFVLLTHTPTSPSR